MMYLGFAGFLAFLVFFFGVINLIFFLKLMKNIKNIDERSSLVFNLFLENFSAGKSPVDSLIRADKRGQR